MKISQATTGSINTISQIKTAAGNVINNVSGSGYFYAPYVPIQQTTLFTSPTKTFPSINLRCNNGKDIIYQFAIGKSYEFLFNYMKAVKPDDLGDISVFSTDFSEEEFRSAIRRYVHEFQTYDKMFILDISEVCNRYHYVSEHSGNPNDDYNITLVYGEKEVIFNANEFIDILDQGIIRELPPVSVGERKLYNDGR